MIIKITYLMNNEDFIRTLEFSSEDRAEIVFSQLFENANVTTVSVEKI